MSGEIYDMRSEAQGDAHDDMWALASLLTGRFGPLALSRAAGKAAAAERSGDSELSAIWHSVIHQLRLALGQDQTQAV